MALYGPFYAGKNAPLKAPWKKAPANPLRSKTMKSSRKTTPAMSPKTKCSSAARQLIKCRGTKRNTAKKQICKAAGKTLYGCRKK